MNAELFVESLKDRGIEVSAENGKLKVGISQSLRTTIAENKEQLLDWLNKNGDSKDNQPLGKRAENAIVPLSYPQQAMWLVEQVSDENLQYNMPMKLSLQGALNIEALEWALNELVRHQSALRSGIEVVSGQPRQNIRPFEYEPLPVIDLSALSQEALAGRIEEECQQELYLPFNLEKDTLIRNRLLKVAQSEYLLLHTLHHIASDGWSLSVITEQLSKLYRKYLDGDLTPLAPLAIEYADYACWQRKYLEGKLLNPLEEFWSNHLLGASVSHSLPLDYPRGTEQTYDGAIFESEIPSAQLAAFKSLCQQHNATLFMGLHAVLAIMMSSLGQDDDIMIGTPVANREDTRLNDIIGLFINTLPLRCRIEETDSFTDLLLQCRSTLLNAFEHQQLPFDLLLERLNIARPQNCSPLFQIMLVLQNNVDPVLAMENVKVKAEPNAAISSKYDLTIYARENEGELKLFWEYNTSLFTEKTMKSFSRLFTLLVEQTTQYPDRPVNALKLTDGKQSTRLDSLTNEDVIEPSGMNSLVGLFDDQVQSNPNNTALIFGNDSFTAVELNVLATAFARQLQTAGVNACERVGIHTRRGPEMVVAILGVLKLGATYVPLDPSYPVDRLDFMVKDAGVELVVISQGQKTALVSSVPFVEVSLSSIVGTSFADPTPLATERGDVATYITYTSGSTGTPKGVLGTERGILNRLHWMWEQFPFDENEMCCLKTSLNFVDHIWELFGPLLKGIPLVLADQVTITDPTLLVKTLAEHNVTRLVLVPSLLQGLLSLPKQTLSTLTTIRYWTCSGETLPVNLVQAFYEVFDSAHLINLYGSSEVSADVCWYDTKHLPKSATIVPIGYPIPQAELYVVNRKGQVLPRGYEGELYVGGIALASGYTSETLTRERFVTLPGAANTVFKTGDLVRFQLDGKLDFYGRNDDQVKVRGHRIELGEVENALRARDGIHEAACVTREHAGQLHLAAYLVIDEGVAQDSDRLHQELLQWLPDYMVPSGINFVERMPLTPSGKLNKKALPEPKWVKAEYYVAPRNELEKQLCKIWEQTLEVDRVGVFDNYYRIGGNSIHAVKLVTTINQQLGLAIQIRDIFEQKTVEGIAKLQKAKSEAFSESLKMEKNETKTKKYQEIEL